ncbi:MAG: 50S ribosomal protein L19, partial [Bacteroidales bacterium]|nr:50S ribosomal protein L19 [Bacteroidales bacterium]
MDLMKVVKEQLAVEQNFPAFKSGDTVTVHYRIKEGNKERIQQ